MSLAPPIQSAGAGVVGAPRHLPVARISGPAPRVQLFMGPVQPAAGSVALEQAADRARMELKTALELTDVKQVDRVLEKHKAESGELLQDLVDEVSDHRSRMMLGMLEKLEEVVDTEDVYGLEATKGTLLCAACLAQRPRSRHARLPVVWTPRGDIVRAVDAVAEAAETRRGRR